MLQNKTISGVNNFHSQTSSTFWFVIILGVLFQPCYIQVAFADEYFDPAALELSSQQQKTTDLHYFAKQGGQQPGTYHVTVLLNDRVIDSRDVSFVEGKNGLVPVLTARQLAEMGVKIQAVAAFNRLHEGESILQLGDFIPDAFTKFDFSQQRLDISIPQVALDEQTRGYIDPSQWDEGVPVAFINYNQSGSNSRSNGGTYSSNYLNLRSGMNIGAWHFRNISSYRYDQTAAHWQSQTSYIERDIKRLKSQFRAGDTYTSGEIFDSIPFRGVQIMSNDNMLPDSQRGFAPVIHGIAHSNAKVTVSQHGYVIYETVVAPGAFEIKDLFPTAQSGDFEVTIKESDGSERKFTQPYSAVPFMLRQGRLKYSASVGRYHYSSTKDLRSPEFMQSSLFYGLPFDLTVYGGAQIAQNYHSVAAGLGRGFGDFGSLSVDATYSKTDLSAGKSSAGQSVRTQYQKDFAGTDTSFSLASYRYSSHGFYSFSEANMLIDSNTYVNNKRNRSEISVSQGMGDYGSVSVSAYVQKYWSGSEDRTIHAGYYSNYKSVSWGLSYYYTNSTSSYSADKSIAFNINIPLSSLLPDSSVSYNMNSGNDGNVSQQVSLSGSMLEKKNLYYTLQQGHDSNGQTMNSNGSLDYRGSSGEANLGYSRDNNSSHITYGLSGGIVAHQHGLTLSQPLGDTFAIVHIPGAANVGIESADNVHTDGYGNAIVPSLASYHKNSISIDTETLGDNIDLESGEQTVIPTNGAAVLVDYKSHIGSRVLFTLSYQGSTPPFGAVATLALSAEGKGSSTSGIVAEQGQVYLSGVPEQGSMAVDWHENAVAKHCQAVFILPKAASQAAVKTLSAVCQ